MSGEAIALGFEGCGFGVDGFEVVGAGAEDVGPELAEARGEGGLRFGGVGEEGEEEEVGHGGLFFGGGLVAELEILANASGWCESLSPHILTISDIYDRFFEVGFIIDIPLTTAFCPPVFSNPALWIL